MLKENKNSFNKYDPKNIENKNLQYMTNDGAEYGNHIKNTYAICNTSASHTYGNVLAVIEKFLVSQFPPNVFRTITASTTLGSRQLNHLPHQLRKKDTPIMVLVPRIQFGQDDRFLSHTLINSRVTNTHSFWGEGSLLELAKDKKKKLYVHGHYNRSLMFVDVVLSFDTYSEQVNWLTYIHNMIPIGHNQFIRSPLELYIPESFCSLISKNANKEIKTNNSVFDFLGYMNSIWYHPITYKLKGGSNSDEFFMYYIADIDTTFQDVQFGNGVKDGQVKKAFDITFTIRCEFNTIGYFTLNAPNIKKTVNVTSTDDKVITSLYSDVINLNDFSLPIGWSILSWPIFRLSEGERSISINPILNQSLNTVIDYHLKFGIPMDKFINIQFRENGEILDKELFYIDWNKRDLHIIKPNYRRTYRLIISVSHEYVNNLIKELYNLE